MAKPIKKTGTFKGKSNKLGHGGRAAQLKTRVFQVCNREFSSQGTRAKGQKNYHGK